MEFTSLFCESAGFEPPVTGEEICSSIRPVSQYVEAIKPKGRNMREIVLTSEEVATGLDFAGIKLRVRSIAISPRFPGCTWVRVRGLPLHTSDIKVRVIFENFSSVVSGPHHVTWRGTNIKTEDRTIKLKLERNIPRSFMTLEGKTRITTRYRDQPKTCFGCGSLDHERRDCPDNERGTYAQAVAESRPEPTKTTEETFHVDAEPPEVTPEVIQTTTSSESDIEEKHKKERRKKN